MEIAAKTWRFKTVRKFARGNIYDMIEMWSTFADRSITDQVRALRRRRLVVNKFTGVDTTTGVRQHEWRLTEDGLKELNNGPDAKSPREDAAEARILRHPRAVD